VPTVTLSQQLSLPLDDAWAVISDLRRFDEWLTLHEAWRSEIPERIEPGTEVSSVVRFKAMRNRVAWRVREFDPPGRIALAGKGVGGTKASIGASLAAENGGTRVELSAEFSNPAVRGPMGSLISRGLRGELERSLQRLVAIKG
jgi:carbon monoxide dehydrogenase subunit G